jgi:Transposase DDE domain
MTTPSGLSYDTLHGICHNFFKGLSDHRRSNASIKLDAMLMCAVGMFQFKYPSMLSLATGRTAAEFENLKRLFGLKQIPSDTSLREALDGVGPSTVQPLFNLLLDELEQRKKLSQYKVLGDYYLCPMDGVEFFSSTKVRCDNCQQKNLRSGEVCYSHAMLSVVMVKPGEPVVLPLDCEPINKQDGESKNDHELAAAKRLWGRLWERCGEKGWKILHSGDALFANGPLIRQIVEHGHSYLLNVKPDGHKLLFEHYNDQRNRHAYERYNIRSGEEEFDIRWCNNLPLNGSAGDVRVNFLIVTVKRKNGQTTTFSWVTNLKITSKNALALVRCGRARWKVENETFNTLKNQGYNFEHNYGHGQKHLSNLLATLMMIVFLIDQIQQLTNKVFQKILKIFKTKVKVWELFRAVFRLKKVNSMKHLLDILISSA